MEITCCRGPGQEGLRVVTFFYYRHHIKVKGTCGLKTTGSHRFVARTGIAVSHILVESPVCKRKPLTSAMSSPPQPRSTEIERDLIRRVRDGDQEAFCELVRPYERSVYFAAKSLLDNEADVEEAAQDAILKAFAHIRDFRGESKFSTWLIQITINEARMKLLRGRRHLCESLDDASAGEEGDNWPVDFADWREIPLEAAEREELREELNRALSALPLKYRQVLICRDIQDLSVAETAQVLGISEASVRTRLLRARLRMRDALAPGFDGEWIRGRSYRKVRPW
jgi:RNA polymerase sigma-70 factor, ECF subfamily